MVGFFFVLWFFFFFFGNSLNNSLTEVWLTLGTRHGGQFYLNKFLFAIVFVALGVWYCTFELQGTKEGELTYFLTTSNLITQLHINILYYQKLPFCLSL